MDIIGIKPAPGDHESNFLKVGSIPCGCNTNGTIFILFQVIITKNLLILKYFTFESDIMKNVQ